jgi:hypothetical protein
MMELVVEVVGWLVVWRRRRRRDHGRHKSELETAFMRLIAC